MLRQHRLTKRRIPMGRDDEERLTANIVEHARQYGRYGYRKQVTAIGAKTASIARGSPWENGFIESFDAGCVDELLDGEIFYSLNEAKIVIESWRRKGPITTTVPVIIRCSRVTWNRTCGMHQHV